MVEAQKYAAAKDAGSGMHLIAPLRHVPYVDQIHDSPGSGFNNMFSIMAIYPEVESNVLMPVRRSLGLGIEIDTGLIVNDQHR